MRSTGSEPTPNPTEPLNDSPVVGSAVTAEIQAIVVAAVALRRTGDAAEQIDHRTLERRIEAVDRAAGIYLASVERRT